MTEDGDLKQLSEAYDQASWAYENAKAMNNKMLTQVAEKFMITAAQELSEARRKATPKGKQMNETHVETADIKPTKSKKKRDAKWGFTDGPHDPRHGERNTYTTQKCRCLKCRKAWAAYCEELFTTRASRLEVPHGTTNGYNNYSCRCEECKAAHREQLAEKRQKRSALTYLERMRIRGETTV